MMRRGHGRRLLRVACAVLLLVQAGCSAANRPSWLQEPGWDKQWSYRSGVAAAVCAAVGAGAGVGIGVPIKNAGESCATVTIDGASQTNCSSSDAALIWGGLIGAATGALLCGILGHVFLDPAVQAEVPPPPPPLEVAAPEPVVKQRIVLRGVTFDFDSSTLRPNSGPVLNQAAELLKENPEVMVSVDGFTDSVGTAAYNQALSVRRAESVYRYLVNRGVDPERLRVQGFGLTNPVASNETEAGRAQNRRVELNPKP